MKKYSVTIKKWVLPDQWVFQVVYYNPLDEIGVRRWNPMRSGLGCASLASL